MKFYIYNFISNNPELTLDKIVTNFRAGIADSGIAHIRIDTVDKYVRIKVNASIFGGGVDGRLISIRPFLYDQEGNDLYDTDYSAYKNHPDWYFLEFIADFSDTPEINFPTLVCTPLKYEYHITVIPHDTAFNHVVLKEVELLDIEE